VLLPAAVPLVLLLQAAAADNDSTPMPTTLMVLQRLASERVILDPSVEQRAGPVAGYQ
jgi:hypothetical protein